MAVKSRSWTRPRCLGSSASGDRLVSLDLPDAHCWPQDHVWRTRRGERDREDRLRTRGRLRAAGATRRRSRFGSEAVEACADPS